jgi:hypothetical protein
LQADGRLSGTESPGDNRPLRARLLPPTEIARSLDLVEGAMRRS